MVKSALRLERLQSYNFLLVCAIIIFRDFLPFDQKQSLLPRF